jgi:prophage regulatory protein
VPHYSTSTFEALPDVALIRLSQIVGPAKKSKNSENVKSGRSAHDSIPPPQLVCISRSTWWRMVKAGTAPRPIKLSSGITAWRVGDLRTWLAGDSSDF